MPLVHAQILASSAIEYVPSILVFVDGYKYLFNVGDGTQRFCMEHHVRLGKLRGIFLTSLSASNTGGLPGMLMTICDGGTSDTTICGPPGTGAYMHATRHFLRRNQMSIKVKEYCNPGIDGQVANKLFDDGKLKVQGVVLSPRETAGRSARSDEAPPPSEPPAKRRRADKSWLYLPRDPEFNEVRCNGRFKSFQLSSMGAAQTASVGRGEVVCYICESPSIRGKFLPKKAIELGVPKGPLFGELANGKDVTLEDGTVVSSDDCKLSDKLGATFSIVSCPSLEHLQMLKKAEHFNARKVSSLSPNSTMCCIFHCVPNEVFLCPEYEEWRGAFGKDVVHILANKSVCDATTSPFQATMKQACLLHEVHPRIFPLFDKSNAKMDGGVSSNALDGVVPAKSLLTVRMVPKKNFGVDDSPCFDSKETLEKVAQRLAEVRRENADFDSLVESVRKSEDGVLGEKGNETPCMYPQVTFLGTGSAQPSKYRNVSSIYVSTSSGGILLDAGEGTYAQLSRLVGMGEKLLSVINGLQCVWISHMHADHHLGLRHILSARDKSGSNQSPLLVIGPFPLSIWLKECASLDTTMRGKYIFVDAEVTAETYGWNATSSFVAPEDNTVETKQFLKQQLETRLRVKRVESVRVKHCHRSYGVVLDHLDGWRLVYSGDARPSKELIEQGAGADLLIHEATFDDNLAHEAVARAHSTVSEALEVSKKMGAKSTVLTHFSQRYPKIPIIDTGTNPYMVAFDLMTMNISDMKWLPKTLPALQCLFPSEPDQDVLMGLVKEDSAQ